MLKLLEVAFAEFFLKMPEERGLPPFAEHGVGEKFNGEPNFKISGGAFGHKHMYMGVPFKVAPKRMDTADNARRIAFFMVPLIEPVCNNLRGSLKEYVKQCPVFIKNKA
jgi:hypothetical protein